jgi:hypothetical protein
MEHSQNCQTSQLRIRCMLQVCPTLQAISPHPLLCSSEPDQHQYTTLFSHIAGHIESASNSVCVCGTSTSAIRHSAQLHNRLHHQLSAHRGGALRHSDRESLGHTEKCWCRARQPPTRDWQRYPAVLGPGLDHSRIKRNSRASQLDRSP